MTVSSVMIFRGSAVLALLLPLAGCAQERDPEAYVPRPGFEAPVGKSAETSAPDSEAFQPRPDFEEPMGSIDEADRPLRPGEDESRAEKEPRGGEEFVPQPRFEAPSEQIVEMPARDLEQFQPRGGFEDGPRKPVRAAPQSPQDPPMLQGLLVGKGPLWGDVQIKGRLRRVSATRLSVQAKRQPLSFELLVPSPQLTDIVEQRKEVSVHAFGRATPVGRSEGLAIATAKRLEYLFERVLGRHGFSLRDRRRLEVRPLTDKRGSPVYRGPCRATYEIPTEFIWAGQRIQLQAGEQGELLSDGRRYAIAVLRSLAHVPVECDGSFELPPYELEYVVWSR